MQIRQLKEAIDDGTNLEAIKALLGSEQGPPTPEQQAELYRVAATRLRYDVLAELLRHFPDLKIDTRNAEQYDLMAAACSEGWIDVIERLIQGGININFFHRIYDKNERYYWELPVVTALRHKQKAVFWLLMRNKVICDREVWDLAKSLQMDESVQYFGVTSEPKVMVVPNKPANVSRAEFQNIVKQYHDRCTKRYLFLGASQYNHVYSKKQLLQRPGSLTNSLWRSISSQGKDAKALGIHIEGDINNQWKDALFDIPINLKADFIRKQLHAKLIQRINT